MDDDKKEFVRLWQMLRDEWARVAAENQKLRDWRVDLNSECGDHKTTLDELADALEELFKIGQIFPSAIEAADPWSSDFEKWETKARAALKKAGR